MAGIFVLVGLITLVRVGAGVGVARRRVDMQPKKDRENTAKSRMLLPCLSGFFIFLQYVYYNPIVQVFDALYQIAELLNEFLTVNQMRQLLFDQPDGLPAGQWPYPPQTK